MLVRSRVKSLFEIKKDATDRIHEIQGEKEYIEKSRAEAVER